MDKTPGEADSEQVGIPSWVNRQRAWILQILEDLRNSDKRCNDGKVRYVDLADGGRIFGDGPVYILLAQEAWLLKFDAPEPDNRAVYQKLGVLDLNGRLNSEVVTLASLIIADSETSQKNFQRMSMEFEEALKAGDLERAKSIFRNAAGAESEMQSALQPIGEYFQCTDAKRAKKLLTRATSLLKAARKFRLEERKKGTGHVDGLAHGELERAIRNLTKQLGRPPFQKEIAAETGLRLDLIRKQLKASGLPWIPAGGRGKDKSPRQIFR